MSYSNALNYDNDGSGESDRSTLYSSPPHMNLTSSTHQMPDMVNATATIPIALHPVLLPVIPTLLMLQTTSVCKM
eukprot:10896459-Ditylum_brightwellii.AAC.1